MTKLEKINGAIIGLDLLLEKVNKIEDENEKGINVSFRWITGLIESKINMWKNIKIKELEKVTKNEICL